MQSQETGTRDDQSARTVTDGRWKLVWNLSDLCELYGLENDPAELTNRFYDPEYRGVRDRYFEALVEEAARVGDAHIALLSAGTEIRLADVLAVHCSSRAPLHR